MCVSMCYKACFCFLKTANCWENIKCLKIFDISLLCIIKLIIILVLLLLITYFLVFIVRKIFGKPWCYISTDISVSTNEGKTYIKEFYSVYNKSILLKYEISAKLYGLLSNIKEYKIPCTIKIPTNIDVILKNYNGKFNPEPKNGEIVTEETYFNFCVKGKKTETFEIVLKCKNKDLNIKTLPFVFKLSFDDKYLRQYSRTITLEL